VWHGYVRDDLRAFLAATGLPYYFLQTTPPRRAFRSIADAVGVFLLMGICMALADLITSRVFGWRGP
jgi:hypothetical protein